MERNIQKQEAIHRMKMLNLHGNVLREFEQEDRLNMSEYGGFLYWLNSDQQAIVDEFEAAWNALVYHVIHSYTSIGEMLTLLYVSNYPEEWEYDRLDLAEGYPLAYVKNLDDPYLSEIGSVGIECRIGGLIRTA
jgi:hypothetical protein